MFKEPAEVSTSGAELSLITARNGGNGNMSFMFDMLIYPLRERTKTCFFCVCCVVLVSINILIEFKPMAVKKTCSWSFTLPAPCGNLLQSTFYPQLASSVKIKT